MTMDQSRQIALPIQVDAANAVQRADVIVVGAGIAGLSSAYKLIKKDNSLNVIILEAKDRVGGRTCGQELKASNGKDIWDVGGQWVARCQPDVMSLLTELDLDTYPQFIEGTKLMQVNGAKISRYESDIPTLPVLSLLDLQLFIYRIERMRKEIDVNDPGACPHAAEWDAITVEEFKNRTVWTNATKDLLDATLRCMFGVEAVHMSLLYFLTYAAAAGGFEALISAKANIGGQELKVKGGAWQICSKLAALVGKDKIQLGDAVSSVLQNEDSVLVSTAHGITYQCSRVIIAIPPHLIAQIEFLPVLPVNKLHVFQRMPVGYMTKVIVTYKTAFWRKSGLSGEVVTSGGLSVVSGCTTGPLCIAFDATTHSGNAAIVSFIGGDQQIVYSRLTAEERKSAVLKSLTELYGGEAATPLDYCEKNWNEEPYNGGCPVSVGTPGMMTSMAPALRQPFDRVHFAGTESAVTWCGFMNGAVQSGHRAATEVLYHIRPDLITSDELAGTVYDTTHVTVQREPSQTSCVSGRNILHLTAGLALLCGTLIIVKRYSLKLKYP